MAGRRPIDIKGQRFGRLVALQQIRGESWLCMCDCGKPKATTSRALRIGATQSCGCLAKETRGRRHFTHGMTKTSTYRSWQAMWGRCTNPNNDRFVTHGARGITVCARWEQFEAFFEDMGERPEGRSLERKDNNGIYEPSNCVWATPLEQARNTRKAKLHTLDGVTDTQAGWARRAGITAPTLSTRLKKGMSLAEALKPKG